MTGQQMKYKPPDCTSHQSITHKMAEVPGAGMQYKRDIGAPLGKQGDRGVSLSRQHT